MCYNISAQLKRQLKYYKSYGGEDAERIIGEILEELKRIDPDNPTYSYFRVNAYDRPRIVVMGKEGRPILAKWGLIPFWSSDLEKAERISLSTFNARSETVFEKPAFREAARTSRCVIAVDGFFEYHHQGKSSFPYYFTPNKTALFILAGLKSEWVNKATGEILQTFTILTTKGNHLLNRIHNNPKIKESRMPVILDEQEVECWLNKEVNTSSDLQELLSLCDAYPSDDLNYINVRPLSGKSAVGNVPEAVQSVEVPELTLFNAELEALLKGEAD